MSLISVHTAGTGEVSQVESNEANLVSGVDVAGKWLSYVAAGTEYARAPAPPTRGDWIWDFASAAWVQQAPSAQALASALQRACEVATQQALDAHAQAWGYDSVFTAASYAASTVPRFKAEALALIAWRDAVWLYAGTTLAAVLAGTQAAPADAAAFMATIPLPPARPT
jgi:hypothetical protein